MSAATELKLEWGTPAPRAPKRPQTTVLAYQQRLCLHGYARSCGDSWRMRNSLAVYHALPATVRAALQHAARAGLRCGVGTHTSKDRSKYEPRVTRATVRGQVAPEVQLVLTLAGFRQRSTPGGDAHQWWGWEP